MSVFENLRFFRRFHESLHSGNVGQSEIVESAADGPAHQRCEDVQPEPVSRSGNSDPAPASQCGEEARPEISRGVVTALGQRAVHRYEKSERETDQYWHGNFVVSAADRRVSGAREGEYHEH